MNELEKELNIENIIYGIRGQYVILDSDLARLYNCKNWTKEVNQAVSRNKERFPEDFYFQLTKDEFLNLKSQIVTSGLKHGGIRKIPYVFTEQGVAMLATVLKTKIAAQTSINIMRAFVAMEKYLSSSLIEQRYFNDLVIKHDYDIKLLQTSFQKFEEKRKDNEIYFDGQIYDTYSKILEIFSYSKKILIIIDLYANKTLLDIVRRLKVNVIIITKENNLLKKLIFWNIMSNIIIWR